MPRKNVPQDTGPFPWHHQDETVLERVIAFLEFLPITKGILRGKQMRAAAAPTRVR